MSDFTKKEIINPVENSNWSIIEQLLREGARKMLQTAIEKEVSDFIEKNKIIVDTNGYRLAVRNGYMPERDIVTGIGPIKIKQPRIDDRKLRERNKEEAFTSDFPTALSAIVGEGCKNVSATTIVRLKEGWEADYKDWSKRDLSNKKYVYFQLMGYILTSGLNNPDLACW